MYSVVAWLILLEQDSKETDVDDDNNCDSQNQSQLATTQSNKQLLLLSLTKETPRRQKTFIHQLLREWPAAKGKGERRGRQPVEKPEHGSFL
jgi:hypothetical protein